MLSIHTNRSLLSALDGLDKTSSALAVSQERLSTGYRINSAKDDAAGLQMASRLAAQSSGMKVAMRNTQNATAMMQTVDSLLGQVGDTLSRLSDLAITAADASTTDDDRAALGKEFNTLSQQVWSTLNDSTFAGRHLTRAIWGMSDYEPAGTMLQGPMTFQIGDSADQTITEDFVSGILWMNIKLLDSINGGDLYADYNAHYAISAPALTSAGAANALVDKLADASKAVGALRSQVGAFTNRLDSVYRNLQNMTANTEAVRGKIMDVDYADETAVMTTHQMLMQAGTAMVKNSLSMVQMIKSLVE